MNFNRRQFLKKIGKGALTAGLTTSIAGCLPEQASGANPSLNKISQLPNILMITCHDIGQHLGCYGIETVHTENLDRLAAKGCRFENFYATTPVCTPSRGSLHTGRYPQSNGLMGLAHEPWGWRFKPGEKHTAAILKDAGYETYLIGLQHLIRDKDPGIFGYDHLVSKKHVPAENIEEAKKLFQKAGSSNKPFFAKVGFFEVHRKFENGKDQSKGVHIPHFLKDTPEIREDLARFQGSIRFFDKCVGEILDALEKSHAADNTLVIFTSDHGIPYIGAKWILYESGIRIPLIMYWPGTRLTGGKVYTQLASNVDVLPTILDLIGEPIPKNIQGVSFKDLLTGQETGQVRDAVYAQYVSHALRDTTSRCIRTERYKLTRYFEPGRNIVFPTDVNPQELAAHTARPQRKGKRPVAQLFDLQQDPHERNNLAQNAKYAEIAKDLSNRLWKWMEEVDDPVLKGPIVTPYYLEAMQDYERFKKEK